MISVVICSVNPLLFSRIKAHYCQLFAGEPHEIIGIHDAKGICEGYNRGLKQSKGDIVIFSHDDIEIWTPEFLPRLKKHMDHFDVLGVAGSTRLVGASWHAAGRPFTAGQITHLIVGEFQVSFLGGHRRGMPGIHAMDGLFLAFRRHAIESLRWDDDTFRGFHCYDVDCTFRAHRAGFQVGVALDLPMFHQSAGNFDVVWQDEADLFIAKHGAFLDTLPPRSVQAGVVQVRTREEAKRLMDLYYEPLPE